MRATAVKRRVRFSLSIGFGFITGYTDFVCYSKYSAFATMMTGNMFLFGASLVVDVREKKEEIHYIPTAAFYFLIVVFYFLGLIAFRFLEARLKTVGPATILAPIVTMVITLICVNDALGELDIPNRYDVAFLAPIFAMQNAVSVRQGLGVATTMATGHLHSLAHSCYDAAVSGSSKREEFEKHYNAVAVIIAIVSGSVFAAKVLVWTHSLGKEDDLPVAPGAWLLMPIAPLMGALFIINDCVFGPHKTWDDSDSGFSDDDDGDDSDDVVLPVDEGGD